MLTFNNASYGRTRAEWVQAKVQGTPSRVMHHDDNEDILPQATTEEGGTICFYVFAVQSEDTLP